MTISKSELNKVKNKNYDGQIKIEYKNEHNKEIHKVNTDILENKDNILITKSNKELGVNVIKSSINKPLEWHITNIKNNNISLKKIK